MWGHRLCLIVFVSTDVGLLRVDGRPGNRYMWPGVRGCWVRLEPSSSAGGWGLTRRGGGFAWRSPSSLCISLTEDPLTHLTFHQINDAQRLHLKSGSDYSIISPFFCNHHQKVACTNPGDSQVILLFIPWARPLTPNFPREQLTLLSPLHVALNKSFRQINKM